MFLERDCVPRQAYIYVIRKAVQIHDVSMHMLVRVGVCTDV